MRSDIITDYIDIERTTGEYYEQLYTHKFDKDKMDKSLERQTIDLTE